MQLQGNERKLVWAGVVLGLGFGGFFDGIVFHQILQWHHMLTSAGYPPDSVGSLKMDTLADGLFHAGTYVISLVGVYLLWQAARQDNTARRHEDNSFSLVLSSMLAGWGIFNLVEGLIDHLILRIHHVRDDLPAGSAQLAWDLGFLAWGAAMLIGGWLLIRWLSQRAQGREPVHQEPVRQDVVRSQEAERGKPARDQVAQNKTARTKPVRNQPARSRPGRKR